MPTVIDGIKYKEFYCQNHNCLRLLCFARIYKGAINLKCHTCGHVSTWIINYGKGEQNIDMLIEAMEGGELKNGGHNQS